jgi:hypothetical protein
VATMTRELIPNIRSGGAAPFRFALAGQSGVRVNC